MCEGNANREKEKGKTNVEGKTKCKSTKRVGNNPQNHEKRRGEKRERKRRRPYGDEDEAEIQEYD